MARDGGSTAEWAEKHGGCPDRFGLHWMVDYTGNARFPFSDVSNSKLRPAKLFTAPEG